jgi:hypothetical protein
MKSSKRRPWEPALDGTIVAGIQREIKALLRSPAFLDALLVYLFPDAAS